ncbi:MAG: hypothetical protein J2P36_34970 [Ktedonobacteraceae bacterium]|nr:hypothetical protein [Ktedonobacteraceae bacterium]
MSWYVELKVFPKEALLPSPERFLALISDHIKQRIITLPCILLQGDFNEVTDPYAISYSQAEAGSLLRRNLSVLAVCDHEDALTQALQKAPYGEQDLYVLFKNLDLSNEMVRNWFLAEYPDHREEKAVVFYALAQPRDVLVVLPGARDSDDNVIDEKTLEEMSKQNTLPHHLQVNDEICSMQWFFSLGADRGPGTFPPEIRAIFAHHFGDNLIIGTNED